MKKKELKKLALLGLAAGVLLTATEIKAEEEEEYHIDLDYVLAKPSCKAHGGCGGLTASRDVYNSVKDEEAEEADDDTDQNAPKKTNIKNVKKSV